MSVLNAQSGSILIIQGQRKLSRTMIYISIIRSEVQKINRLITMSVKEKNEKEREVEYFHRTIMDQK